MFYELEIEVESPLEGMFLADCVTIGLVVVPQYKLGRYRLDFAIPERRIAIEIDGKKWHGEDRKKYDDARDDFLAEDGWVTIRIAGDVVYHEGENIAAEIKEEINSEEFLENRRTIRTIYRQYA